MFVLFYQSVYEKLFTDYHHVKYARIRENTVSQNLYSGTCYAVYARHIKQITANKLSCHKNIPRQAVIQSKAILKL